MGRFGMGILPERSCQVFKATRSSLAGAESRIRWNILHARAKGVLPQARSQNRRAQNNL